MAKKDRKFDFMDIGVMEKYPFPDIKESWSYIFIIGLN